MAIHNLTATPDMAADIPPQHKVYIGQLATFELPSAVRTNEKCITLGKALIDTWRKDGILQIKMTPEQGNLFRQSYEVSKVFFKLPYAEKVKYVDD